MTEGINHVSPNERLVQLHKDLEKLRMQLRMRRLRDLLVKIVQIH